MRESEEEVVGKEIKVLEEMKDGMEESEEDDREGEA